jgi:hypothetical protein
MEHLSSAVVLMKEWRLKYEETYKKRRDRWRRDMKRREKDKEKINW